MDVDAIVGDYQIIEHIGRGGMADVWSARDRALGRMVAIKTIARNLSDDIDPVAMFEQEAKTIANLEHPHILPIYGFGEFEGKLYIAMRYVTGGSLEDRLRQDGAMHFDKVAEVGRAIANALEFAHTENIVHLDLKPPNILLDAMGSPYLADFGLATIIDPSGRANNPGSGTLLYMAPEQILSDTLTHVADIYSFSLVLFHMLTGELPFEGSMPLAFKQIQFKENLPHLGDINKNVPDELTDILRRGTTENPEERYRSARSLMEDVEHALGVSQSSVPQSVVPTVDKPTPLVDIVTMIDPKQVEQREAEAIYRRAHLAWANGRGRFLLSVTHFIVMSDYYRNADNNGLEYDDAGAKMLLRGALEYDYDLDYWWQVLDNDSRRWVCLHTIRSETPQARIRAFYRLETLPDDSPPQIPPQVAAALSLENNEQAILAGLTVLSGRAHLINGRNDFDVKTEYRGEILNTSVRDTLQLKEILQWREIAYSPDIDRLIVDMALDGLTPDVEEMAARVIGQIRSAYAVRRVVNYRVLDQAKHRRTLAFILDEALTFPPDVPPMPRFQAWVMNSWRRLTENPLQLVQGFGYALLGGALGMGQNVYLIFRSQGFFSQQRVTNTLGMGLLIGLYTGLLVLFAKLLPERLAGFWTNWVRWVWSAVAAYFLGQLIWWSVPWALLQLNNIPQDILILVGLGTIFAIVPSVIFKLKSWQAVILSWVTLMIPLGISTYNQYNTYFTGGSPLFGMSEDSYVTYYDKIWQIQIVLPIMALLFALGFHFPSILSDLRWLFSTKERAESHIPDSRLTPEVVSDKPKTPLVAKDIDTTIGVNAPKRIRMLETIVPATNEFEMRRIGGKSDDAITSSLDPKTEEFEMRRIGGKSDDAITSSLDPKTEEFEMGMVGGKSDDATDWDAITSSLDSRTEEFEVGMVGGNSEQEQDDGASAWDIITKQLDDMDGGDSDSDDDTTPMA